MYLSVRCVARFVEGAMLRRRQLTPPSVVAVPLSVPNPSPSPCERALASLLAPYHVRRVFNLEAYLLSMAISICSQ